MADTAAAQTPDAGGAREIDDKDSGIGSNDTSAAVKLESKMNDYQYENGRRYHAHKDGVSEAPPKYKSETIVQLGCLLRSVHCLEHLFLFWIRWLTFCSESSSLPA